MCRYTQNIEVPHCADAPDRAAHQRLLRLRPRCLGQRRRLWSHKVFLFNCFVFLFACLDLFRRSSGFVMKFASTILHWNTISPQGAEDRRGEVLGPCQLEKDQHERLPRGDEADKKVSRSCFTKKMTTITPQVGVAWQPGAVRGLEPEVWGGRRLDPTWSAMHLWHYIFILPAKPPSHCLSRPPVSCSLGRAGPLYKPKNETR